MSGGIQMPMVEQLVNSAARAFQSGRLEEAADLAGQALRYSEHGGNFAALSILGSIEMRRGDFPRAKEFFTAATHCVPDSARADLAGNLCSANRECFDISASIAWGRKSVSLEPSKAFFWLNLALSQTMAGELTEARQSILNALILEPDYNDAHICLGHSLLRHGEYTAGFRELMYWKGKREEIKQRIPRFGMVEWNGMRFSRNGKLVVVCDEGLGDAIQYARWLPAAADMCGCEIIVFGAPELSILAQVDGVSRFCHTLEDAVRQGEGAWTRISMLPALLPMPAEFSPWLPRPNVPAGSLNPSGFRVGLCWRGNPFPRNRSMPTDDVAWMVGQCEPTIDFVSLQHGVTTEERNAIGRMEIATLENLEATARVIAGVDLVVSIDTVVAHLAGAMGGRGIVALSASNDWRWGLAKSGPAPCYPSLNMIRQDTPGQWRSVAAAIADIINSSSMM